MTHGRGVSRGTLRRDCWVPLSDADASSPMTNQCAVTTVAGVYLSWVLARPQAQACRDQVDWCVAHVSSIDFAVVTFLVQAA